MALPSVIPPKLDIDYRAVFRGVWRRHKLLVALTFFGVALPLLVMMYFTSAPLYTSKALISIDQSGLAQIPFLREPSRRDTIATHMVLLKSRSLSQAVIEALPRESFDELLAQAQYTDYWLLAQNTLKGWLGKPPTVLTAQERALTELRNARMLFIPAPEAENVFVITASATTPRVAVDLVNTHIKVLLDRTRTVDQEDARRTHAFLEAQHQQAKDSLARSEEALAKLQQQKGRSRSDGAQFDLVRLAQLESALADAQASKQVLTTRAETLRRAIEPARTNASRNSAKESEEAKAAALAADQLARGAAFKAAQEQLAKLEAKLTALRERYTDAHPQVQATLEEVTRQQAKVTQLARELPVATSTKTPAGSSAPVSQAERADLTVQLASLDREVDALDTKEQTLQLQISRLRGTIRSVGQEDIEFGNLRRAIETNRNLVSVLAEKLTAIRIREQGEPSVIRVVDPPSPPVQPATTRTQKFVLAILALAGSLSLGLAVGLEIWRQPVETEAEVAKATGLPVLGSVGVIEPSARPSNGRRDSKPILLPAQPFATSAAKGRPIHVELYRAIRANIETERLKSSFRTIMITSAGPHEGKSTTILNLAHAFQAFGRSVLVVEADLRRPSLAAPLALTSRPGLADFLSGTATLEQVSRRLPSGVTIVPGQVARGDVAALLASARFKALLQTASAKYDLILVDSAPVLAVPDNLLLAHLMDRIVLVAKATTTSARDLRRAQAEVERGGGRVLGVILNQAHHRDVAYYHPRYRKYYPSTEMRSATGGARQNATIAGGDALSNGTAAATHGEERAKDL